MAQLTLLVTIVLVEVGARGYVARSLGSCWRQLGLPNKVIRKATVEAGNAALRASFWIWTAREKIVWDGPLPGKKDPPKRQRKARTKLTSAVKNSKPLHSKKVPPTLQPQLSVSEHELPEQKRSFKVMQWNADGVSTKSFELREKLLGDDVDICKREGVGLINLGNTCYLNAVLQCLSNVLKFFDVTLGDPMCPVAKVFCEVVDVLNCAEKEVFAPRRFKKVFGRYNTDFDNNEPQDAHEFFLLLFASVHLQTMTDLMRGRYASTLCCQSVNCPPNVTYDDFLCIEVNISSAEQRQADVVLLEDLLGRFTSVEQLDQESGWKCDLCGGGSAEKKLSIEATAPVVVIVLKRFAQNNVGQVRKHDIPVTYPLRGLAVGRKIFRLRAVVCHTGSRNSGHYVALVKGSECWKEFNDNRVSVVTQEEVCSRERECFMFFYEESQL